MRHRGVLDAQILRRIDDICGKFASSWKSGSRPELAPLILGWEEPVRSALLRELLLIELAYRRKSDEQPSASDYLTQFPGDAETIAAAMCETDTAVSQLLAETMPRGAEAERQTAPDEPASGAGVVPLNQFIESLTGSGLMTRQEVQTFIDHLPPHHRPTNGKQMAEELFRQKKLTRFQTQTIYQGRTRGLVVGNYVVLDRLGRGGMGQVYKARHQKMDRVVAIKMLPAAAAKSEDSIKRFHREAKAAAKLTHPNIVTAYDADEHKGVHFLVMEYVEGQDLARLVRDKGRLSVKQAVDCVLQAARGLEYSHQQGITHRDIKPHNLLLDRLGTVKILDMGLARIDEKVGIAAAEHGLTQSGEVMGTLDYMSPEQTLDSRSADHRADIYSLGCTLWFLLTGRPPFPGGTVTKSILAHRMDPAPSLHEARPEVPESLDRVFRKMLAKKPEDRPQTMSEVIAEMEACVAEGQLGEHGPEYEETVSFRANEISDSAGLPDIPDFPDLVGVSSPAELADPPSSRPPPRLTRGGAVAIRRMPWMADTLQRHRITIFVAGSVLGLLLLLSLIAALRSTDGELVVEVDQPGAKVRVVDASGHVELSATIEPGRGIFPVARGEHMLRMERDGFETFEQKLTMESRGQVLVKAELKPKPPQNATLVLRVNESGADVEVLDENGKILTQHRSQAADLMISVSPGKRRVTVEKEGFQRFVKDVPLVGAARERVEVALVAIPPIPTPPKPGSLAPAVIPSVSGPANAQPPAETFPYERVLQAPWVPLIPPAQELTPLRFTWGQVNTTEQGLELRVSQVGKDNYAAAGLRFHVALCDVAVRARVRQITGGRAALKLRVADGFYEALFSDRSLFQIAHGQPGKKPWTVLASVRVPQALSLDFEFGFAAVGDTLAVFVNRTPILVVRDQAWTTAGEVHLCAHELGTRLVLQDAALCVLDANPSLKITSAEKPLPSLSRKTPAEPVSFGELVLPRLGATANVEVRGASGLIGTFQSPSGGLFIPLPPGDYQVQIIRPGGITLNQKVAVSTGRLTTVQMPQAAATAEQAPSAAIGKGVAKPQAAAATPQPNAGKPRLTYFVHVVQCAGPDYIAENAPFANLITYDGFNAPELASVLRKARECGVRMMMWGYGLRPRWELVWPVLKAYPDVLTGIVWQNPDPATPETIAEFGRELKRRFPRAQYWVIYDSSQFSPAPPEVDVVGAMISGRSVEVARMNVKANLDRLRQHAGAHPIVLFWSCWTPEGPGFFPTCERGVFREYVRIVEENGLAGCGFFLHFGAPGERRIQGIATRPDLMEELRDLSRELGVAKSGQVPARK